MEDSEIASAAAEAVLNDKSQKEKYRVNLIKGHVQKLVPYLQHAQSNGCFTLEQASQVFSILLAIKQE